MEGYIDASYRLGWNSDQCAAFALGRARVVFCRALFQERFEYPPEPRPDLSSLFHAGWDAPVPEATEPYVKQVD